MTASIALVVGEALTDIVIEPTGPREHPGGSPMNVSLGLARLGMPVTFGTRLGDDRRGDAIREHLRSSGVVVVPEPAPGTTTSTAAVELDSDGVAQYVFDVEWSLDLPADIVATARHVHFGSISAFLRPGSDQVESIIRDARPTATVSYDPNIRPQFLGSRDLALADVERHLSMSDVVKASDEDLAWLYPGADPEQVIRDWLRHGPSLAVVTRGADGALAATREGVIGIQSHRVEVVDTIGAGDSFMSGLIAALAREGVLGADKRESLAAIDADAVRRLLELATACAAYAVTRSGAQPPRAADVGL